jgi:hypothetical protein
MLLAWTLTCLVALALSTGLLLLLGHRLNVSSRFLGVLAVAAVVLGAGQASGRIWQIPSPTVLEAEGLLASCGWIVVFLRPRWNPTGQVFFGSFLGAAVAYLAFAARLTFDGGLSAVGMLASSLLLVLEVSALTISAYFTFESLDVTIRTRTSRPEPPFDPAHLPRVSLQVPAYNEPPDMLIETIRSLEGIDYPDLEILVVDNNTEDKDTWRPVEQYCRDRPRVRFFHVDDVEGYKAGALNLSLRELTDPAAELIGIVDADYLVNADYLEKTVGYFVDPNLAFLQTPQDYREFEGDTYLTACYDAYRYFFATSMPSRNERNSIIFAADDGPDPALCPRSASRMGPVVHHRGRRGVPPSAEGRLLRPVPAPVLRSGHHAAHLLRPQEPALPLVLRRHSDPAQAHRGPAALAQVAGQPAHHRAAPRLSLRRCPVVHRPAVPGVQLRPRRHGRPAAHHGTHRPPPVAGRRRAPARHPHRIGRVAGTVGTPEVHGHRHEPGGACLCELAVHVVDGRPGLHPGPPALRKASSCAPRNGAASAASGRRSGQPGPRP